MTNWSRKTWIICIGVLLGVSFLFQARLFFPHLSLVATPEFELNDAIQLSFASKFWYFMKLHAWQFPFWSTHMGAGFPVLGEGQTGIFYLPNIIFYSLFPTPELAYNISLVFITFLTACGTCIWLGLIGSTPILAVLGGMTFATSGFFLFHLQHMTLLQSFSLLPWLFIATHSLIKKQRFKDIIFFAFLLSQQIFAGFIQAVFITAIGTTIYAFFMWNQSKEKKRIICIVVFSYVLGLLFAAPQLLPSIEFYKHVVEQSATNDFSTKYSFAWQSFLSFLNPFAIGNPQNATYYNHSHDEGLLFWETNGYIGLIPLLFGFLVCFWKKIQKQSLPWIVILITSILLMLGKYSPFYFIFDFFPFSLFRVPARFIAMTSFMIVTIAMASSNHVMTKKTRVSLPLFTIICWTINLCSLLPYWYTYHDYQSPTTVEQAPESISFISKNDIAYRFDTMWAHRELYLSTGWNNPEKFTLFQNALRPNTNIFWGITIFDAYPSRTLTRKSMVDQLINENTEISNTHTARMSAVVTSLLRLTGNTAIISGDTLDTQGIYPDTQKITDGTNTLYLYTQPKPSSRAHFVSTVIPVMTMTDVVTALQKSDFDPNTDALIEGIDTKKQTSPAITDSLSILQWSDMTVRIKTHTEKPTTVICDTTYYPGWIGLVDGHTTHLYAANISSTAIPVPAGDHIVELRYRPVSLIMGLIIAGCTVLAVCGLTLFRKHIRILRKLFPK